jgi:hypothetical protein
MWGGDVPEISVHNSTHPGEEEKRFLRRAEPVALMRQSDARSSGAPNHV